MIVENEYGVIDLPATVKAFNERLLVLEEKAGIHAPSPFPEAVSEVTAPEGTVIVDGNQGS